MKLLGNGKLFTRNPEKPYINDGCVVFSDNNIVDFGETAEMKTKYSGAFISANGGLIMPGFINAHTHIYSAMARGMNLNNPKPNLSFQDILENLWWRMDRKINLEDVKYSAYTTLIDSIKNGVTTVFDHHASFAAIDGSLFTIADVAKELGIRTSLCFEVSDRNGKINSIASVAENLAFIEAVKKDDRNGMIDAMVGIHASFTVTDHTLARCAELANNYNSGCHIHTAEGPEDQKHCLKNHGIRVVERLNNFNILGEKSIAVHCIHVDENEKELLRNSKTAVVHNPQSNMGNAVGCSEAIEMLDSGMLVGMGTDGYTADMLDSMKTANTIHKHRLQNPSASWGEPPAMLFESNRTIAERHFARKIGMIEKGYSADIVVINYSSPTPIDETNLNGHMHFGMYGANVNTTIINGQVVMKDRKLLVADEEKIFADSRALSSKLWARI